MISEGDRVNLYFEYVQCEFNLTINHVPQATGDSWMATRPDGTDVYFQTYCKMVKLNVKKEDLPF